MKIILLGAGQVGSSLAYSLVKEGNDITLIDTDHEVLEEISDKVDLRVLCGNGAHPDILEKAGAQQADMIVALTKSDEVNMIACQVSHVLFKTPKKIARIRTPQYLTHDNLFITEALAIDVVISPEILISQHIEQLIDNPGALQVLSFANDSIQLIAMRVREGYSIAGKNLQLFLDTLKDKKISIPALFRNDKAILPDDETTVEIGDEIFFLSQKKNITSIANSLRGTEKPNTNIIIAGGGNIGSHLASSLEKKYETKIIDRNQIRSKALAGVLENTTVLTGDASDEDLLLQENIESMDIFCALTSEDEANIVSSMLAKRLGTRRVITLITKPSYEDIIKDGEIDITVSPQQITISSVLSHIRQVDVVSVHALRGGNAEALEFIVHGDKKQSDIVGKKIKKIKLPSGCVLCFIIRKDEIILATDEDIIESEDHIILFLTEKKSVPAVEKLFQVKATYMYSNI